MTGTTVQAASIDPTTRYPGISGSWHDEEATNHPDDPIRVNRLCSVCMNIFSNAQQPSKITRHIRFQTTLVKSAMHGCQLCANVWAKIQQRYQLAELPEDLGLTHGLLRFESGCELVVSFNIYKPGHTNEFDKHRPNLEFRLEPTYGESYPLSLATDTASTTTQMLARQWVKDCAATHDKCNFPRHDQTWTPTRLVYIGMAGQDHTIQIIETSPTMPQTYIALSHCWGPSRIITLTTDNFARLKEGVPLTELPKTFRECIVIAAWFNIEYLWIDSLCIIQDSSEDWRKEAITMQDVYKNALLTIAATGAPDGSVGCFHAREQVLNTGIEIPFGLNGGTTEKWICFDRWMWEDGVSKAPLNTRAWVVQERLLSRRMLHFGAQQVFWECHELDACEACPDGLPRTLREIRRFKSLGSARASNRGVEHNARYKTLYGQWEYIVDAYSSSDLTRTTDKVVALSGIAADMAASYGDEYLAGLWRQYLPEQLLWKVSREPTKNGKNSRASRSPYYRAPSWSWLSIDGPVDAGSIHGKPTLVNILEAKVEADAHTIKAGSIRLSGVLRKAVCEADPTPAVKLYFDFPGGHAYGELDDKSEQPPKDVFCIPINTGFFSMDSEWVMFLEGLIVCLSQEGPEQYQRIGWFSADYQDYCEQIAGGPLTIPHDYEPEHPEGQTTGAGEALSQVSHDTERLKLFARLPTRDFTLV